jgi:hypothetical protein
LLPCFKQAFDVLVVCSIKTKPRFLSGGAKEIRQAAAETTAGFWSK